MLSPLDYVLLHLGSPGRYQLFIAFLIYCLQLPISFSTNLWTFYADEPPHRCHIPVDQLNGTTANEWIPTSTDKTSLKTFDSCSMYVDNHNHWKGVQYCVHGWDYKPPESEHNIILEWDLVCDKKSQVTLLYYVSCVAAIFGGIFFGLIADHFERKTSLLISLYLFIASAFSLHFVYDFISFSVCFSLQTFFVSGVLVSSYILLLELFPTPYQLQVSLYMTGFGITSSMFLPLLMWIIKSWRYVQLAVSAPGVVFLAHLWLLPQSPLWLTLEGKMLQAENLIENLARSNGKSAFPPSFRLHLRNLFNSVKSCQVSYNTRHRLIPKFSSPCLRWIFLVHFYLFFVTGLTTETSESHVMRLNENKYADKIYRSLIDVGVMIFVYYFATRLGPRSIQSVLFFFAGLMILGSITLQETIPRLEPHDSNVSFDYRILLVPSTLISAARSLLKSVPALVWFHAAKTLPTGIRGIAFASCYAWTILGQMAAPHLMVLSDVMAPFIPIGTCGIMVLIAGGLSLLLPSCWRRPLPNSTEEAENRHHIPAKERYPSFRELNRSGKLTALACPSPVPSNVYSIAPTSNFNPKDNTITYNTRNDTDTSHESMSQPNSLPKQQHHNHHQSHHHHHHLHSLRHSERNGSMTHQPHSLSLLQTAPSFHPHLTLLDGARDLSSFPDDSYSRLSDMEDDIKDGNWRLFHPNNLLGHKLTFGTEEVEIPDEDYNMDDSVSGIGRDTSRDLSVFHTVTTRKVPIEQVYHMPQTSRSLVDHVAETNL